MEIRGDNYIDTAVPDCRAEMLQGGADKVLNVAGIFANMKSPGVETAEVQEIPEETIQAFRLLAHRVNQISTGRPVYQNLPFLQRAQARR